MEDLLELCGIIIIYYDTKGGSLVKEILKRRNIEYLFHFTRVENLESILINGLVPRENINNEDVVGIVNDGYRHDDCEDANCLSVEFPNYKMFYTLCCNNPETEWAVLVLDAKLIKKFDCAFCYANAGSEEIYTIPIEERMGAEAFEDIFAERDVYPSRKTLAIPEYYPTNPQAEVLVFGTIPIIYIKCVIFKSKNTLKKYESVIPSSIKYTIDKEYFYGRSDNKHWR